MVSLVALAGFVRYETRIEFPMLDPRLFRIRRFALGSLTITMAFMVMFGMFFLITLYLQFVQGYSALGAAVRTLPFAVTMIAGLTAGTEAGRPVRGASGGDDRAARSRPPDSS